MSDPVIEFFTEKEWYDQDEISLNKRLAVRDFYQWLTSRPTPRALDAARRCPACKALLEDRSVYCDVCGTDTPRQ